MREVYNLDEYQRKVEESEDLKFLRRVFVRGIETLYFTDGRTIVEMTATSCEIKFIDEIPARTKELEEVAEDAIKWTRSLPFEKKQKLASLDNLSWGKFQAGLFQTQEFIEERKYHGEY